MRSAWGEKPRCTCAPSNKITKDIVQEPFFSSLLIVWDVDVQIGWQLALRHSPLFMGRPTRSNLLGLE